MLKESVDMLTGNERFEGFVFDVIDEISKMLVGISDVVDFI